MRENIAELIHKGGVYKDVEGSSPEEIYGNFVKIMNFPEGLNKNTVFEALCSREKIMSTAVGGGIALPHARFPVIKSDNEQQISVVYLKKPIDMNAPDERKVFVMFVILTSNQKTHIQVLSELVQLFQKKEFKKLLEQNADEAQLLNVIRNLS